MKKPKPLSCIREDYPSLRQFASTRRGFLRKIAATSLSVGVVSVVGPSLLFAGDPTQPQRLPGVKPAPVYDTVEIPTAAPAAMYLAEDEYVLFKISLTAYDETLTTFCISEEAELVRRATEILQSALCSDLTDGQRRAELEQKILVAFGEYYTEKTKAVAQFGRLELIVESCQQQLPLPGEAPMHDYP